jgi:hypothetical protein
MSIFSWFFKGSFRKILAQMVSDTNVIQMAVGVKLASFFQSKYGIDRGLTITAAVSNKLFAKVSPRHSKEDLELADHLASDILKTDAEIRYAALMSCRARLLFETELKTEDKWVTFDTIQWMANIWELPPDQASPDIIRQLANNLHKKYLNKE